MQKRFFTAFSWYAININKILFYTCGIILIVLFLERTGIIFSYEGHTAGIDNNFDYAIIRSLAGYSLYPNPSAYPFAVNPYAPLFFLVCKNIALLFHITAADTIAVYRVSRAVALLADTGTCMFLFLILRRVVKASQLATIFALSLFFAIICYLGYTINRSDALFLFFYCCTLYFLSGSFFTKKIFRSFATAISVTLCIYSKQNGITLLFLVPVWLYLEKDYRSLFQFLLFTIIFCPGLFIYFEYYYTNHFFSAHIIDSLKNKIDPRWFYVYVFKLIADTYMTVPLAVSIVISANSFAENDNPLLKKTGAFFLLQFLLSTALCFKWGSSRGYYNECFLLSFINITAFYSCHNWGQWVPFIKKAAGYIYPALLAFMFTITAQLYFFFLNSTAATRKKYDEQQQVSNYIKKEIGAQNRYVIDLSNADFNFFKNMLYKNCAAPNIDAVSCCTLPDKIFDYSGLLEGIKTGKIIFIIENNGEQVSSLWGAGLIQYKKEKSFPSYTVYKYDSLQAR